MSKSADVATAKKNSVCPMNYNSSSRNRVVH